MNPKCITRTPALLGLKRYSECRVDGDVCAVQGGEMADDLRDVLNAYKLYMMMCIEHINFGAGKSLKLISSDHDGNLHTRISSLLLT